MAILDAHDLDRRGAGGTLWAMRGSYPNRIKEWRRAAGLTQAALAERLGCNNQTLSRYERGERSLTVDLLMQIAPALGCRPADLLPDPESMWDDQVHRLAKAFASLAPEHRASLELMILSFAERDQRPEPGPLRRRLH